MRGEYPPIILASHEAVVKMYWPGRKLKLDKACLRGGYRSLRPLQKSQALCLHGRRRLDERTYTVCESAAKDPSHDLAWGWPAILSKRIEAVESCLRHRPEVCCTCLIEKSLGDYLDAGTIKLGHRLLLRDVPFCEQSWVEA